MNVLIWKNPFRFQQLCFHKRLIRLGNDLKINWFCRSLTNSSVFLNLHFVKGTFPSPISL